MGEHYACTLATQDVPLLPEVSENSLRNVALDYKLEPIDFKTTRQGLRPAAGIARSILYRFFPRILLRPSGDAVQPLALTLESVLETGVLRHDFLPVGLPVWSPAVGVGDPVLTCQLPGTGHVTRSVHDCFVRRQGGDAPADEERAFRFEEVRILLAAVAPVQLSDAEVFQNALGAEKSGRDRQDRDPLFAQFLRQQKGE